MFSDSNGALHEQLGYLSYVLPQICVKIALHVAQSHVFVSGRFSEFAAANAPNFLQNEKSQKSMIMPFRDPPIQNR